MADDDLYGYATSEKLVAMKDTQVVGQENGEFGTFGRPFWSQDGRYLVAISGADETDPSDRRLVAIDSTNGRHRDLVCESCSSAIAQTGGHVVASQESTYGPDIILRFNLATDEPPVKQAVDLGDTESVRLLASAGDKILAVGMDISEPRYLQGGTKNLYFLSVSGEVRQVATVTGPAWMKAAQGFGADGQLAIQHGDYSISGCITDGMVSTVTPKDGKVESTDTTAVIDDALLPRASDIPTGGLRVGDMWWSSDGHLHATMIANLCDPGSSGIVIEILRMWSEWVLEGEKWRQVSPAAVLSARELNADNKVVLTPDVEGNAIGDLSIVSASERTDIAEEVLYLVSPIGSK